MRITNLEKYGVEYVLQNPEIAIKHARSQVKSTIKFHWLTKEELICRGGYETKVIDYLNVNKINYKWQPETFNLSTRRTYTPDLYLIDEDIWVEIKGWMRPYSKPKWDEFHTTIHQNSELWNKAKLKQMKII